MLVALFICKKEMRILDSNIALLIISSALHNLVNYGEYALHIKYKGVANHIGNLLRGMGRECLITEDGDVIKIQMSASTWGKKTIEERI